MRIGAYPGSFNPPTVAHLALAEAAGRQAGLDRVDLVVSRVALGKADLTTPTLDQRVEVLRAVASSRPWLGVVVTDHQLLADIADGYDALVVGSDKWAQVLDPAWYGGSVEARDRAVARLPLVLVAPRIEAEPDLVVVEPGRVEVLALDGSLREVSSTGVRRGRRDWMVTEAAEFDARTGWWTG